MRKFCLVLLVCLLLVLSVGCSQQLSDEEQYIVISELSFNSFMNLGDLVSAYSDYCSDIINQTELDKTVVIIKAKHEALKEFYAKYEKTITNNEYKNVMRSIQAFLLKTDEYIKLIEYNKDNSIKNFDDIKNNPIATNDFNIVNKYGKEYVNSKLQESKDNLQKALKDIESQRLNTILKQ